MLPLSWLLCHFIADFVLQSNWMATNKSKNWAALTWHVFVYSICWFWLGATFVVITYVLHTLTDAVTSRITSRLWFIDITDTGHRAGGVQSMYFVKVNDSKRHWFFVVIGFDQLLHYAMLYGTGRYLGLLP